MPKQPRRGVTTSQFWLRLRGQQMFAVIPTLLTLGNSACGFGSITYAAKVGPETASANNLYIAALLIFVAMIFDMLDGPVARLSRQTSGFGAQLDSLSDAISFGVAPAFLMLQFSHVFHPRVLWVIAVLYVLAAVLRLARFNVNKDEDESRRPFCGLPSPAAAGTVASLVIINPAHSDLAGVFTQQTRWLADLLTSATAGFVPVATLIVACLMVSRVPYPRAFSHHVKGRVSYQRLVKFVFILVVVAAFHELAMPLLFIYYVTSPVVRAAFAALSSAPATEAIDQDSGNGSGTESARHGDTTRGAPPTV